MRKYGIAFDIGTTTITAGITNLSAKKEIAGLKEPNPQQRFGRDVISRIGWCIKNKKGLNLLHKTICSFLNTAIKDLTRRSGINKSDIEKVVFVGNTAMEHFLLGLDPAYLSTAPYLSKLPAGIIEKKASDLGLSLDDKTRIYLLPVIRSFVGSDLTAGVLYTKLFDESGINLFIDIGTNGEIALKVKNRFFVASTAAGPAFEGSGGISGSDIIKIVASMLKSGIIEKTGRLKENPPARITQEDIRQVQFAKAAIMAGMLVLIRKAGLGLKDIDNLYVAGNFGNYIDKRAGQDIGLLPRIAAGKIKPVGNAAYKGAVLALCSEAAFKKTEKIAKSAVHISLFASRNFKEEFIKHMEFL